MPENTHYTRSPLYDRDTGDEAVPLTYPHELERWHSRRVHRTHAGDFETEEIQRLTAQLNAARLAYNETRQALILDNPSGGFLAFAAVRAALERIGQALGMV